MSQRNIEIRVGVLILLALALLAGFVVVMGGLSLEPTFTVNVEFDNPGGLKSGSPVKLSGIKIGRISAIEFQRRKAAPGEERPPLIRVVADIERQYADTLYENSQWFVTTQGVLGELFLSVEPGTSDRPLLKDGATVVGVSPPRLDLLLSESYELLHKAYLGIRNNEEKLAETFDGLHRTLKGSGRFFDKNGEKLDSLVDNVESLSVQANETMQAARQRYVDNPQIQRIITNVEQSTHTLNQNVGPLVQQTRETLDHVSNLMDALGSEEQVKEYKQITKDLSALTKDARSATAEAHELIRHVQSGRGTVGALIMDEALYDDIQELLRDLKHNPWKFFWRE